MLQELQSLDAAAKKRVLVITTVIIMAIIVSVWIVYFNNIVIGTAQQQAAPQASSNAATTPVPTATVPTAPARASGPGLWQNIENAFGSFLNLFRNPSHYNIQPSR